MTETKFPKLSLFLGKCCEKCGEKSSLLAFYKEKVLCPKCYKKIKKK